MRLSDRWDRGAGARGEGTTKSVKVLLRCWWCVIAICGNNWRKGSSTVTPGILCSDRRQYYHLDATFDNTLGKHQGNAEAPPERSATTISIWEIKYVPGLRETVDRPGTRLSGQRSFLLQGEKLSLRKREEVYKRAQQMAKRPGHDVPGGRLLTREVLQELLELIRKGRRGGGRRPPGSASTGHRRSFISAMWKMQASRSRRSSATPTKENSSTPGIKVDDVRDQEFPASMRTPE